MEENDSRTQESIFSLDIGTRSLIGVVGHREGDLFSVEASAQVEHPKRAMIDGQIEDISQVARVAGEVKQRLEEALGRPLRRVAVAAAGRALKTCRATWSLELPGTPVDAQTVYELENKAVNEARHLLERGEDDQTQYYCVGHSVVRYTIDGYPFSSILDHHGKTAQVDIIATFLPTEVVTSLRRCMELIGLEIDTLTLEPIAAMRAVLPADVRLLNLAMVDIGAGTADIALTRDGTVSGYTMATVAGDEITEAIIRKCLVDFETAEGIKLALAEEDSVTYTDILGHQQSTPTAELLSAIDVSVEMMAKVIADRIEEANGGPPTAVFLVGGGSRTPGICEKLAENLALESDKVALAGTNFTGRVLAPGANLDSPEYATPVGIALTAADEAASGRAAILVNDHRVRLYTTETSSVMDALLLGGYHYSDLMGRNGRSVTFQLNGERKVARGGQYTVADITLGGKPASLSSPVENGDVIAMEPATSGEDAKPSIASYAGGALPLTVTLNGSRVKAGLLAFLNGTPAAPEEPIHEQDEVEISTLATVGDLCRSYGISPDTPTLTLNGEPTTADTLLQEGDHLSTRFAPEAAPAPAAPHYEAETLAEAPEDTAAAFENDPQSTPGPLSEDSPAEAPPAPSEPPAPAPPREAPHEEPAPQPAPEEPLPPSLPDEFSPSPAAEAPESAPTEAASEPVEVPEATPPETTPKESDEPWKPPAPTPASGGTSLRIQLNGRTVVLPPKAGGASHFLLDMLPLVDIDPNDPKGMVLIRHNGKEGAYLDELASGDSVEIRWENEA